MGWFISWYLTVTLLGWLTFPLAYRLFPALADRGYSLSRAAGLLVWGYVFWLLASLRLSQNDIGGLLLGLLILAGLSFWSLRTIQRRHGDEGNQAGNLSILVAWVGHNRRLVLSVEGLFLVAFAFLAFARASNPELTSAEKPMELMFINAILRSPTFPPHDAWLSGYAISYYYFGYVMAAMLAKLTGVPGSAAHNLMTSLIFALGAIGSYGILYNLLSLRQKSEAGSENVPQYAVRNTPHAFLAPLFLLIVSNAEGFLEILHRLGLFWTENTSRFWLWLKSIDGPGLIWNKEVQTFNFWTWLDIKELNQPPVQPLGWIPERYLWWWRASRVISDYDLGGGFKEIIDEFPFFSFLHADLHPHVLAIPFGLLAIAAALNLFLGGWRGELKLSGFSLHLNLEGFAFLGLLLGGLAFLNTWDILIAAVLIVGAYVLSQVMESGWGWGRGEDAFILGIPLGALSFLLYLPFYIGFSSQLGGILPNLVYPTRGAQLWVMLVTLLLPLFAYLIYVGRAEKLTGRWPLAFGLSLGLVLYLWGLSWLLGLGARLTEPDLAALFLQMQGVADMGTLFRQAGLKRLLNIGSLLTLLAVLIPALAFLLTIDRRPGTEGVESVHRRVPPFGPRARRGETAFGDPRSTVYVLLLIFLGALLLIGPEFVYLRDQFGTRINTVFKFYYQAWMVWSLAASYGIIVLARRARAGWNIVFSVALVLLLLVGLAYPILSILNRTGNFRLDRALALRNTLRESGDEMTQSIARQELDSLWTLDYFEMFERQNPDEAAAIRWLEAAPDSVVAEAIGGSYSAYARVSTLTGLPTVLGWPGHESQWRGGAEEQGTRQGDIETLYGTGDWQLAREIIARYNIRYVFVGNLERGQPLQEQKFQSNMRLAFQQGNVAIYEAP
jgi:YYY domain-containing protein